MTTYETYEGILFITYEKECKLNTFSKKVILLRERTFFDLIEQTKITVKQIGEEDLVFYGVIILSSGNALLAAADNKKNIKEGFHQASYDKITNSWVNDELLYIGDFKDSTCEKPIKATFAITWNIIN